MLGAPSLLADTDTAQGSASTGAMRPNQSFGASASETGQQLKQQAAEVTEQLKNKGGEALQQARDQAREMATQQRDHLLDRLAHCSAASRKAAEQLRADNDSALASAAEAMAERIDRGKAYLREREFSGMIEDAENLARWRPEVFFTGMFVAGLILTRFMKASTRSEWRGRPAGERQQKLPRPDRHVEASGFTSGGMNYPLIQSSQRYTNSRLTRRFLMCIPTS